MVDAPEIAIDIGQINSLRKHLKKLHSTTAYLQRYCRWNYYKPHPDTQLPFHNSTAKERSIVLGTQQGKTYSCSMEMAFQACAHYPDWYEGCRHVVPKIERAAEFIGWYGAPSSQVVRDGAQQRLAGDIAQKDGLGMGAIPLDLIRGITLSRGIPNFIDTITVARETGGTALLQSRTYEQSPLMWQSVPCDLIWLDEDMGYDERILNECLGRVIATNGRIIVSLTPVLGLTPIRKRFIEGGPGIFQVRGGIEQALHIPKERHAEIIAATPKREVAARIYGQEMQGEGAVFSTPISQIAHGRSHASMPLDYGCVWGCDFNRGGSHPFVAVFAMHDRINDVIYIMDIVKMGNEAPDLHAARIKSHPCWDAPFLYPHDGGQVGDLNSGDTIAHLYRRTGLNLPHGHVTFPEGGYSLSAGIVEMEQRFCTGRLLIAEWCLPDFRMEYANYHYKDGKIVRQDDDVLDAIRVICMGIRFARSQDQLDQRRVSRMHPDLNNGIAEGLNFCPWCGREPCECTGVATKVFRASERQM